MPPFSLKNATRTQISIRSLITIHFYTGVTPATYRLDAFRINYRKGGLIGTYVYLALQKPFRESPSSETSHSRSRGQLHDRNGKTAATKILRSAGDAARLCARYHLPSSLDGAECHHDQQKRLTRRRQQQADDAHSALIKLRGFGLSAGHFTHSHYAELFSEKENDSLSAIESSLSLGIASATLCAILGTLIVLTVRRHKKSGKILEAQSLLPEMLPGIVLVIGIMLFWNDIYSLLPLYNTMAILVITYVILFLPYTVQYVTSAFTQMSESLTEAGRVFGGSSCYIFRHITLPLILKGVCAGWMMTFIISVRELVAPSLIAPPNTLVISTYIMREFEQGSVSLGMSMAVLCVAITVSALMILKRRMRL